MRFIKVDIDLVVKASSGDRNAFSDLYRSCYKDFYNFALYTLGNPEDAADVVADVFVEIWKSICRLRNPLAFSSWAFKILSARCRKEISETIKRRGVYNIDEFADTPFFSSEDIVENISEDASLSVALLKLSPEERMIVILYVLHGYTHREIAQIIGKPEGTVKSRLYRAYAKLRKLMKE